MGWVVSAIGVSAFRALATPDPGEVMPATQADRAALAKAGILQLHPDLAPVAGDDPEMKEGAEDDGKGDEQSRHQPSCKGGAGDC